VDWFVQRDADVTESNESRWIKRCMQETLLPKPADQETVEKLQKMGIVFVKQYEDTPKLWYVTLPLNWQIVGQSRRGLQLLDETNKVIAAVIVKMGGYDDYVSLTLQ